MRQKVDAILISPKVASGLTPIVNKAYRAGIPVIVLDRDLTNDQYTQFIGGDNRLIGNTAGNYAVQLLGGKGKARGTIVEIWGGMASTPAQDRHDGFNQIIDQEPGISMAIEPADGDWKQDKGYEIPGDEGVQQVLRVLAGAPIAKRITLPTMTIDKSNARDILLTHGLR
jgi:ribose transport system substrate-binding protein